MEPAAIRFLFVPPELFSAQATQASALRSAAHSALTKAYDHAVLVQWNAGAPGRLVRDVSRKARQVRLTKARSSIA